MREKRDPCSCTSVVRFSRAKKRNQVNIWGGKETAAAASPMVQFYIWGGKEKLAAAPPVALFSRAKKQNSGQHMGWIRDTCSYCLYNTFCLRARSLSSDLYTRPVAALTCSCTSRGMVFQSEKAKSGQHSGEETPAAAPPMVRFSRVIKLNQVNIVEKKHLQLRLSWYGFRERKAKLGQYSRKETPAAALPVVRFSKAKKQNQVNIWVGNDTPAAVAPTVRLFPSQISPIWSLH